MIRQKYIVVKVLDVETPILFPDQHQHRQVSLGFGLPRDVVSAGFVTWGPRGFYAFGESFSLDIKSRGSKDSQLINETFGVLA